MRIFMIKENIKSRVNTLSLEECKMGGGQTVHINVAYNKFAGV